MRSQAYGEVSAIDSEPVERYLSVRIDRKLWNWNIGRKCVDESFGKLHAA